MKVFIRNFLLASACLYSAAPALQAQEAQQPPKLKAYYAYKPARRADVERVKNEMGAATAKTPMLPLWTYGIESPRDQSFYTGVMVGNNPFAGDRSTTVPAYIVPIVIQTNTVATAISSQGVLTTVAGITKFDPTAHDTACLSAPNNVPANLVEQSPIFNSTYFNFGGTPVGRTQYIDAFQRASFWKDIGASNASSYHLLLKPRVLAPVFINVPAAYGAALPPSLLGICGPLAIVDIGWFDNYIDNQVLPALAAQGVNSGTFPILPVYNLAWSLNGTNVNDCCVLGYHSTTAFPIQTYSPASFLTNGVFSSFTDTYALSHEVAEWADDPFGNNLTPAWGNTGQVAGCQNNLEVGDPLSGTPALRIHMPNGFTYHLQEQAMFSWFFGAPSIGINGWYSNNATFLTDAGPVCQSPSGATTARAETDNELKIVVAR